MVVVVVVKITYKEAAMWIMRFICETTEARRQQRIFKVLK